MKHREARLNELFITPPRVRLSVNVTLDTTSALVKSRVTDAREKV